MDRTYITHTIHYTIPQNIEEYLNTLFPPGVILTGCDSHKVFNDHIFLNDEDFVRLRNSICGEFVDKIKILRLLDKLLTTNTTNTTLTPKTTNKSNYKGINNNNNNSGKYLKNNNSSGLAKFTNINFSQ